MRCFFCTLVSFCVNAFRSDGINKQSFMLLSFVMKVIFLFEFYLICNVSSFKDLIYLRVE